MTWECFLVGWLALSGLAVFELVGVGVRTSPACGFCSHVHTEPTICRARAIDGGPCVCTQAPTTPPGSATGGDHS